MPRNALGAMIKPARFKLCPKCSYGHQHKKCPKRRSKHRFNDTQRIKTKDLEKSLAKIGLK